MPTVASPGHDEDVGIRGGRRPSADGTVATGDFGENGWVHAGGNREIVGHQGYNMN